MMKGAIISATALNGSAALPFVIPSEAEDPRFNRPLVEMFFRPYRKKIKQLR
jgi:hypothetical protein